MNPKKKSLSALYFRIIRTACVPSLYRTHNLFTKFVDLKLKNIVDYIQMYNTPITWGLCKMKPPKCISGLFNLTITGMKEAISQLPGIFRRKENLLPNHWNINSVDRLKPNFKPTPIALPIFGLWRLKRSANIRKHKRK